MPFLSPFLGEGSPTKIDCRKMGTVVLNSLLEDLVKWQRLRAFLCFPGGEVPSDSYGHSKEPLKGWGNAVHEV